MVGLFKLKSPASLLLLLLFGILVKLPIFYSPALPSLQVSDGVLYKELIYPYLINNVQPIFFSVLVYVLLVSQAIQINLLVNNQRMLIKPSYLVGMAYLIITSLVPEWSSFSTPLIANSLLLWLLNNMLKIYNTTLNVKAILFNSGLIVGVASFIFIPSFLFLFWLLISVAILRPFKINEWLLCIIGGITPFYFYAAYLLMNDSSLYWQYLLPTIQVHFSPQHPSEWQIAAFVLLGLGGLLGIFFVRSNIQRLLIFVRKSWSLMAVFFIVSVLITFVGTPTTYTDWLPLLIPLAAVHAGGYSFTRPKFIAPSLFWVMIAFIVVCQYWEKLW